MNQHLERLDGLAAVIRMPVVELLANCEKQLHRTLLIVYGARSVAEQALIYQQGRSLDRTTGEWVVFDADLVVTNSKPGFTAHNVIIKRTGSAASMAVDLIPLNADGSADWDVARPFWEALWELAWKVGLDPLGDTKGAYLKKDLGHFQEPGWKLKLDGLGLMLPGSAVTKEI
jgi:hypothetical protein